MDKIKDNQPHYNSLGKPEIIVVNIQKFKEDHNPVVIEGGYSTNLQRVFFIDEAHRGYNPAGSFLANLLEADKDAIKIAMTGTPLLSEERASWRVFGGVAKLCPAEWGALVAALGYIAVCWGLLYFLYRKGLFFKA